MQLTWFGSRQTYSTPPSLLTTARDLHLGSYPCVVQVTPIKLEDVVDLRTEPYHPQCIRQLAAKCKAQRCYESQSRQLKMKVKKIISMLHAVKSPLHTSIHCLHHWPYQSKMWPTALPYFIDSIHPCSSCHQLQNTREMTIVSCKMQRSVSILWMDGRKHIYIWYEMCKC